MNRGEKHEKEYRETALRGQAHPRCVSVCFRKTLGSAEIGIPADGRTSVDFGFRNLSAFFDRYELKSRKSLGRHYRVRVAFGRPFGFTRSSAFRRAISLFRTFVVRSVAVSLIAAVVYSVTPGALSAPKSVSVSTRAEWERGMLDGVSSTGETDAITLQPDGTWTARSLAPAPDNISFGSTSVMVGDFLYVTRGYGDKVFYRYDTARNEWENVEDLPQPAHYGCDAAYDGDRYLYMIFGGYSKEFYRYDIEEDSWEALPDLLDTVYAGAAIEFDGTDLYIARGQVSTDFWKFDISEESWYNLAPTSGTFYTGSSLVSDGTGYLYGVRGYNSATAYRYDISGNSWSAIANAPGTFYGETKGVFVGGYAYFLRSNNTNAFYRYDPSGNTWTTLENAPAATNYASLAYHEESGRIYVVRGNGTYTVWQFDPSTGTTGSWVGPADFPAAVNTGSDLIWNGIEGAGSYVYGIRGGANTIYRLDTASNTWTLLSGTAPANLSYDTKGTYHNGNIYIPRGDGTGAFYRYDIAGSSWSAMTAAPGSFSHGASAAYNASDGYIYVLRGNAQNDLYRYDIAGNSWTQMADAVADGFDYRAYIGGRLESDGTDLYAMFGDGETAFLKYDTGSNTWTTLDRTPFSQYYGADMTYHDGRIVALAGWYRDETWEYDIASDMWRELPKNQEYTFGRGPYSGASVEYAGGDSYYATPGFGLTDVWSFTEGMGDYPSSGTYVSETLDLSHVDSWTSFTATENEPTNTSVTYETRTSDDGSDFSAWEAVSGTDIASPENRYLQVRITLSTTDGAHTPSVSDFEIAYASEDAPPSNPTGTNAYSTEIGGELLVSGTPYRHAHPYFSWSGASDTGSGIVGYHVYFGTDPTADPEEDGTYQEEDDYTVNLAMETGEYVLRIRAVDGDGNVATETFDAFTYSYDGVSPYLSETRTSRIDFEAGTLDGVVARDDGTMRLASSEGFWNESRLSFAPAGFGYGAELVFVESSGKMYSFRGGNQLTFYSYDIAADTWTTLANAPETVNYGGFLVAGPDGYLYGSRGIGTSTFWRYDISANTWETVASAPKSFTYGSSLSFDGSRYVYAFPGTDDAFYRYDTETNAWTTLPNAEFGNPNENDGQQTALGSDSVHDGENAVYVLQGNYYPYLAKYAVSDRPDRGESANTWTQLAKAPVGVYVGGSITYDGETGSLYLLAGNYRQKFYRYDIAGDFWEEFPEIPAYAEAGGSLQVAGGYVYALRGAGSNALYRFNLDEGSWESPSRGFFGPSTTSATSYFGFYYGTELAPDDEGGVYVARGNYDNAFGRYDADEGGFEELSPIPVGTYNGVAMTYDEDGDFVYAAPGGIRTVKTDTKNNYFLRYDTGDNEWHILESDPAPLQTGYGSSLAYDGSRYLYLTRGSNTATWWRYDTQAAEGARWSAALPTTAGWAQGYGSRIVYRGGYVYSTRGQNSAAFYRYDTSAGTWTRLTDAPGALYYGGSLADGGDGYLYATRGNNTNGYYRYAIASNTWETVTSFPGQIYQGGTAVSGSNRIFAAAGNGTNSYQDGIYSYVVGSEEDGTGFEKTGEYVSDPMDLISVYRFANLTVTYDEPDNTDLLVYTRTSEDGTEWSSWDQANNDHDLGGGTHRYDIVSAPAEYVQVKFEYVSNDRIFSPSVSDYTVNYYQDLDAPENPKVVSAYADPTRTVPIVTDTWYAHATPSFEWPAEGESGGATDGEGGSGIAGYWVYFGTEADADPFVDGEYQTATSFDASGIVSGETYYLRVKTEDNAGMVPSSSYAAFIYRYDATVPTSPSDISVTPAGYTSVDSYSFLWQDDAVDAHSGIDKLQYRTGGDDPDEWFDISDPLTVSLTIPNAEHLDGAYQSGKNTLSLRVVDMAGNASPPITQDYYYSATAPTPPRNLAVSPESSSSNSFAFSWETPESFIGDIAKIKYYYSVNALPTAYNTVETTNTFAGPGPFATQRGPNTFYVVAMDEAENIDYDLYAEVTFEADTSAPPVPVNVQAFDTSDRESAEYSVAVKWSTPSGIDEDNFAGYAIFRSLDGTSFEEVATTTGSAYVDTGLESRLYYYYVKSKDRTNNYSIGSSTVSLTPTGRYTRPPTLVGEPKYAMQSFAASFSWATNRVASSFVEYGTSMSLGKTNGQVDSVTDHAVSLTGLSAGTKYYYRVKFIDPDGNIGMSDVATFTTLPPPTVSEFTVTDITLESAYVSWKTNASAICTLRYGVGSLSVSVEETTGSTSHVQKITGLVAETGYIAQVECVDEDLNEFSSDQYSFSTPVKPVASDVFVSNRENVDLPTVIVEYKTNVPTTTLVTFGHADEVSPHTYLVSEYATEHRAELAGLDPAKEYTLSIGGTDQNGIVLEAVEQKITTRSDSRPPEILTNRAVGKTVGRGKNSQANLYVKIETNEPTKVRINYAQGVAVSNFEQSTTEDPLNTYHLVTIPAEIGQVYSYQALVTDEAGNPTTSAVVSVVVEQARETAAEVISGTISSRFGWIGSLWN